MWEKIREVANDFSTGVLTALDTDGFPMSIRVIPTLNDSTQSITMTVPEDIDLQVGSANLLFHYHNEELWDLRSHLIRGTIEKSGDNWILSPNKVVDSASANGLDMMRSIIRARKNAKTYLEKHNIQRPKINWDSIKQLRQQAK